MFKSFTKNRNDRKKPAAIRYAPGTNLSHDPTLVTRLKGQHRSLYRLFADVRNASDNRDYRQLAESLRAFHRALQQHLAEENLRIYIYLGKCAVENTHDGALITEMKRQMGDIGKTVNQFVNRYGNFGVNNGNIRLFNDELAAIGRMLRERVEREETTLFELYRPPDEYRPGRPAGSGFPGRLGKPM